MCIDIDIDLYGYCSVKFQFSSTYVWPNPEDAWISHACEHAFPFSFLHIVCRSSKVFIVIKATKAGAKPCRFRGKTFYVGEFSNGYEGPKVIVRSLINLPEFLWPQTDLRIADLENTDLENVVCVLLKKPQESWHCPFVNHFVRVFSLVMSAIVLRNCWAYESRENTNFSFNSGLQRFVFIIFKPDGATSAISLVFDRPMSQKMTYFSGVLVLLLMGAREAKDNTSGGMCISQSP